jgi:hypothetical protein
LEKGEESATVWVACKKEKGDIETHNHPDRRRGHRSRKIHRLKGRKEKGEENEKGVSLNKVPSQKSACPFDREKRKRNESRAHGERRRVKEGRREGKERTASSALLAVGRVSADSGVAGLGLATVAALSSTVAGLAAVCEKRRRREEKGQ